MVIFRPATLRRFLLRGSAAVLAFALLGATAVLHLVSTRRDELERSTESLLREEQIADHIVAAVHREVLDAMHYLHRPRPASLARFRQEGEGVYANLTLYLFRPLSLQERMQVERIKELHQGLEVAAQSAFDLALQGRHADVEGRTQLLYERMTALQSAVDAFVSMRVADRTQLRDRQSSVLLRLLWFTRATVILTIASLILLLVSLQRRLLPRLGQLTEASRAIASGDYGARLPVEGTDELATVARSFNEMAAALQEARAELELRNVELGRTLESLRGTQRELVQNEKLSALGGMLAGLAHELNNPLASVLGNAELLSERLHDSQQAELRQVAVELADPIAHEALRARELVRNLLQFSRKSDLRRGPVSVNEAMRVAVALRSYAFAQAGLDLCLTLEPDLWIEADLQRLEQTFLNVVNNAFDALNTRGGGFLEVIGRRDAAGNVVVVFQDDGPGLTHPERVFDPFYTTKPVGYGTGLGLTLVHRFVEEVGGSVVAENDPRGGARFVLRLPAMEAPALPALPLTLEDDSPVPTGPGEEPASAGHGPATAAARATPLAGGRTSPALRVLDPGRLRVLVLDDEEPIRSLHRRLLAKLDVEVLVVASAPDGRELLEQEEVDLVISDIKMPGEIDGIGLYDWVRRERPGLAERFLFVTGDVHDPALTDLLETSPERFITKPFQVKEYLALVRRVLESPDVTQDCA